MNNSQRNHTSFIFIDYFSIPLQWNFSLWTDILLFLLKPFLPVMQVILYFHEQSLIGFSYYIISIL